MSTELSTLKSQVAALRGAITTGCSPEWLESIAKNIRREYPSTAMALREIAARHRAALAAVLEPAGDAGQVETWIDASSQQPPDREPVLVILPEHLSDKYNEWGGHIGKARWLEDHWQVMGHGGVWRVSHWMPLPKMPAAILATAKEENNGN